MKSTNRRVPHWAAMAQSLAGGCPGLLMGSTHLLDPKGVADRDCQLTAL